MLFRVICHLQPAFAGRFVSFRFAAGRRAARFRAPPGGGSQFRGSRGAGFGAVSGALSPAGSLSSCAACNRRARTAAAPAAEAQLLFPCDGSRGGRGLCPAAVSAASSCGCWLSRAPGRGCAPGPPPCPHDGGSGSRVSRSPGAPTSGCTSR